MPWYRRPFATFCIDAALAAFVCGPLQLAWVLSATDGATWPAVGLLVVQGTLLLGRRRFPALCLGGVLAAAIGVRLCGYVIPPFPLYLALGTYAAYAARGRSLAAAAFTAALAVAWLDRAGAFPYRATMDLALVVGAWAAGDAFRSRRAELEALRDRAARAEREREERAARAVADEQARIARELHDVLAHNVSVVVVQAAAAQDVFDAHPERAREALRSIETTGREAMGELRRLLGVVRRDDAAYRPQPGLGRLDELVEQVRAGGLSVAMRIEGAPRPLPAGVDLSAYRIVQEALTNTLRHAGATRAEVAVRYEPEAVVLEVRDDGVGAGEAVAGSGGSGHGLVGMRERAALTGGSLEAGPAPGGGFRVHARLPEQPVAA